ncbi:hypothetical protein BDF21DRAFT_399368 [Thamnidium elegans]|nr:hypothetical protein BDF21DRAFT_399368 [Thamnidium elegans]
MNFLDPILSPIRHCPDKNKLLVWLNRQDENTSVLQPDVTMLTILQNISDITLGYVEVKPDDSMSCNKWRPDLIGVFTEDNLNAIWNGQCEQFCVRKFIRKRISNTEAITNVVKDGKLLESFNEGKSGTSILCFACDQFGQRQQNSLTLLTTFCIKPLFSERGISMNSNQ